MWKLEGFTEKFECISYITISTFLQVLRTVECARTLKNNKKRTKMLPHAQVRQTMPSLFGVVLSNGCSDYINQKSHVSASEVYFALR